jgi:hypothetical protein
MRGGPLRSHFTVSVRPGWSWTKLAALLLLAFAAVSPTAATAATKPLNPAVQISAMACPSGGNCTAVGTYTDGVADGQGLLLKQAHGVWATGTEAALPSNASIDPLSPANNTGLADVSCVSAGNCTAVGVYTDATNNDRGLLLTETGGRWQRGVEARLPSNVMAPGKVHKTVGDNLVLLSDACTSVGNCYAVGNYFTGSNTLQPLIIAEHNGRWQKGTVAPLPVGAAVRGQKSVLYAITCLQTGACTAVGAYVDSDGDQQAMLLSESGGSWSAATEASLPTDAGTNPAATTIALDCVAIGDCTAVGYYQDSHADSLGVMLSESGGSWSTGTQSTLPTNAAPPTSYNAQTTVLATLACPDATDCTAGGAYTDAFGNTQALLVTEAGGIWGTGQQVTLPSNAEITATDQTAGIGSVSCPTVGNCVAGGAYTDTAENNDSLLVTESGGVWSAGIQVALPADAGQSQYSAVDGVRCESAGNCTAIGTYDNSSGDTLAYTLNEVNGVWAAARALSPPGPTSIEVDLSVESLLLPVGKDATVAAIKRAGLYEFPYVAVKPGKLTVDWFSTAANASTLVASASVDAKAAGTGKLTLRLTRAGHKLFAAAGSIKLISSVAFKPTSGHLVTATKRFTLR